MTKEASGLPSADLEQGRKDYDCWSGPPQLIELSTEQSSSSSGSLAVSGYITFRPLQVADREQVQELHEEWFPVTYKDEFYDELVLQRMVKSGEKLFTCAAIFNAKEGQYREPSDALTQGSVQQVEDYCRETETTIHLEANMGQITSNGGEDRTSHGVDDQIVACIVGSLVDVSRIGKETSSLLISDADKYARLFYIMTLGTVTEFRNYRLATALVKKCIDLVERDQRCGALYLHVITSNTAAIQFYEKLGFYRVKEIPDYYRIDGNLYNAYLYARYFHGNRGHWDMYYAVTRIVAFVWKRVTAPLSLMMENASR